MKGKPMGKVRIFSDGKFQHMGIRASRLYDPYAENFPFGIWRFAVAVFDHGFNRYHRGRRKLYLDVPFERIVEVWKKLGRPR